MKAKYTNTKLASNMMNNIVVMIILRNTEVGRLDRKQNIITQLKIVNIATPMVFRGFMWLNI